MIYTNYIFYKQKLINNGQNKMFNLKQSCIFDMDIEPENTYLLNDNLYILIFDFLSAEDLPKICLCSRKFNLLIKSLDYKYKQLFEEKFCSSYKNYE